VSVVCSNNLSLFVYPKQFFARSYTNALCKPLLFVTITKIQKKADTQLKSISMKLILFAVVYFLLGSNVGTG